MSRARSAKRDASDPWGSVYQRSAGGVPTTDDIAAGDRRVSNHLKCGSERLAEAVRTMLRERAA